MNIHIGDIKIPLNDYAIAANAVLGIRGSGKTVTAKRIAEQMVDASIPIVVFDPIGSWRHLKTAGSGSGIEVVVAGGESPDLPLNVHSAPAIVRAAISGNIPLIIDLYDPKLSKADWRRIVRECFTILFFENKGVRHIFLEESAEFVPQIVRDDDVYSAVEKLARMGGNKSLGLTLINQRAQEVNKAVLELCDNVVLLRQRGKNAISSLQKQIDLLNPESTQELTRSLPGLVAGECWVISAHDERAVRTQCKMCSTYHPDRKHPKPPDGLKSVDATRFIQKMEGDLEKVIADAKANDVGELRKRIAQLEAEAKSQKPKIEEKEVATFTKSDENQINRLRDSVDALRSAVDKAMARLNDLKIESGEHRITIDILLQAAKRLSGKPMPLRPLAPQQPKKFTAQPTITNGLSDFQPDKMQRGILAVLAQFPEGCSINKIALLARYSISGGFRNALSALRTAGAILGENTGVMRATEIGIAYADSNPLPSGEALVEHWKSHPAFSLMHRQIIDALHKAGESTIEAIAENCNPPYAVSGGFRNALSDLRTAGVIIGKNTATMKLNPDMF